MQLKKNKTFITNKNKKYLYLIIIIILFISKSSICQLDRFTFQAEYIFLNSNFDEFISQFNQIAKKIEINNLLNQSTLKFTLLKAQKIILNEGKIAKKISISYPTDHKLKYIDKLNKVHEIKLTLLLKEYNFKIDAKQEINGDRNLAMFVGCKAALGPKAEQHNYWLHVNEHNSTSANRTCFIEKDQSFLFNQLKIVELQKFAISKLVLSHDAKNKIIDMKLLENTIINLPITLTIDYENGEEHKIIIELLLKINFENNNNNINTFDGFQFRSGTNKIILLPYQEANQQTQFSSHMKFYIQNFNELQKPLSLKIKCNNLNKLVETQILYSFKHQTAKVLCSFYPLNNQNSVTIPPPILNINMLNTINNLPTLNKENTIYFSINKQDSERILMEATKQGKSLTYETQITLIVEIDA